MDFAYWHRLVGLGIFLAIMAGIDWQKHGKSATRWREYLFMIGCSLLGAMVGIINDQITVTISPEYFRLGKGIEADNLRLAVAALGFQAGFFAGVIIAMAFLLANNPKPDYPSLSYQQLCKCILNIFIFAFIFIPIGIWMAKALDPFSLAQKFRGLITEKKFSALLTAWGIHAGLYMGAIVGMIYQISQIRRLRKMAGRAE